MPVVSKSREEVADHFGWMSYFVGADCPASGAFNQERLGWVPGLLADLEQGHYFDN